MAARIGVGLLTVLVVGSTALAYIAGGATSRRGGPYSGLREIYASDLRWTTEKNGWGPAERDRSNGELAADDGNAITLGTERYDRGIGAHAPSQIVIDLSRPCSLFLADVGIDEEVGDGGSVEFQIWGDGNMLASSGLLRGRQTSVRMAADIQGVRQLSLVVTKAGDGKANDHADWANARLGC